MTSKEDVESYLIRMGVEYEEVDDNMWLLKPQDTAGVVVNFTPPVVLLRLKVMELPRSGDGLLAPFYRRLLELNASDIVHGSYGIEENDVVVAEGTVLARRTDGTTVSLVFCDVFDMRAGRIRRLVSYLMEVK